MQELCQALHAIIQSMILVTGGTGFIGQALIQLLVDDGHQVRTLIRPSPRSPRLPTGVPVEVAVTSLLDERGVRAAMVGVDTVYHLAGVERRGAKADLMETDIRGTRSIVHAAQNAAVKRIFYISHLGAERASAYPVLKAKAIAEAHIRRSGIDFTILRTAMVFGPGDGFTTGIAQLLEALPFGILMPGDGDVRIQPLWINDLVTCLVWGLDDEDTRNQIYDLGGPEYLSFREILEIIMAELGLKRAMIAVSPPYLRAMTVFFEYLLPMPPVSVYWLDYFATNRTCALDTIPRVFNLLPARFSQRLDFLQAQNWRRVFWRSVLGR